MIIIARPPNFERIQDAFPKSVNPGVMFAYAGNIYNPSGIVIPPELIAHEEVHLKRQESFGADNWWNLYLVDSEFRYYEELLAHVAELKAFMIGDRNAKARGLMRTACRLIAPLYNYQPPRSYQEAVRDLRREIEHA